VAKAKGAGNMKITTVSTGSDRFTVNTPKKLVDFVDETLCKKLCLYPSRSEFMRVAMRNQIIKDIEMLNHITEIKLNTPDYQDGIERVDPYNDGRIFKVIKK